MAFKQKEDLRSMAKDKRPVRIVWEKVRVDRKQPTCIPFAGR